jgi:hypothetical protein
LSVPDIYEPRHRIQVPKSYKILSQIPAIHIGNSPVVTIEFDARVVYISRRRIPLTRGGAGDKFLPPTRVLTPTMWTKTNHDSPQSCLCVGILGFREVCSSLF